MNLIMLGHPKFNLLNNNCLTFSCLFFKCNYDNHKYSHGITSYNCHTLIFHPIKALQTMHTCSTKKLPFHLSLGLICPLFPPNSSARTDGIPPQHAFKERWQGHHPS